MKAVFVSRGDTQSPYLYAHFPIMVAMLSDVMLVSLSKGAESRLCQVLGLRRVGVVGVMVAFLRSGLMVGGYAWCGGIISDGRDQGPEDWGSVVDCGGGEEVSAYTGEMGGVGSAVDKEGE
jgi:hypothetical protein